MKQKKLIGNLMLLFTAVIWGAGFVAQRAGMEFVGPLTFGASRFWLAFLVLIPVVRITEAADRRGRKEIQAETTSQAPVKAKKKTFWLAAFLCGTVLFCGSILQQYGLVFTTAGKAAFITALYILLVPVFSLVLRHRPSLMSWIGVMFGTVGLYFLCITDSFQIAYGDFIVLIGAFFWASHVLLIDRFLPEVSPARLAMAQFGICALYNTIGMLLFEHPTLETLLPCLVPIAYAGIMSGGVGFTLQIFGQRYTSPTVASLLMSMEAVFGAIFGFLILKELMSARELIGCLLMFAAIIISQLPSRKPSLFSSN